MIGFGEIDQNDRFWAKMEQTGFFCEKAKMSLPYAYYDGQTDGRTNERTDKRADESEFVGPNSASGGGP